MGLLDNAKDAGEATAKKVGEFVDDTKERVSDAADQAQANVEVSKAQADLERAEAEAEATKAKNQYKEDLR